MYKKLKKIIRKYLTSIFRDKNFIETFDTPSHWIEKLFDNKQIYIVQVGSNDGISGDPLHDLILKNKEWRALFIEPVPYLFEKLKSTYQNQSRFKFENVAINDGSSQIFYSVRKSAKVEIPELPKWYDQLGSFNKKHITKHLNGVLEPFIEESAIKGVTLPQLLDKNAITNFDLLHIDAEGFDWMVLSQIDLKIFTPEIILYEHKHLAHNEKEESLKHLKQNKYKVFQLGSDFICIKYNKGNLQIIKNLRGLRIN